MPITIADLISELQRYNPNLPVIYCVDDDSDKYNAVKFLPSLRHTKSQIKEGEQNIQFIDDDDDQEGNAVLLIN